jgi:hypothetical protein
MSLRNARRELAAHTPHIVMTPRRFAHVLAVASLLAGARTVRADGEESPMFGIAAIGAQTQLSPSSGDTAQLAGVALELAWWHGHFGLAGEASGRWGLDPEGAHAYVLGGSARLLVVQHLIHSLIEPRDVELGVELQAIVERAWWSGAVSQADPTAYGGGVALRLRGGGDPDGSILLAESRLFVRVMSSKWTAGDIVARTAMPTPMPAMTTEPALTVLVGLGGAWGTGDPDYVHRFRMRPLTLRGYAP